MLFVSVVYPVPCSKLRVPDLARDVVPVNVCLLQEHVQTSLVLSQRVSGNSNQRQIMKGEKDFDVQLTC